MIVSCSLQLDLKFVNSVSGLTESALQSSCCEVPRICAPGKKCGDTQDNFCYRHE